VQEKIFAKQSVLLVKMFVRALLSRNEDKNWELGLGISISLDMVSTESFDLNSFKKDILAFLTFSKTNSQQNKCHKVSVFDRVLIKSLHFDSFNKDNSFCRNLALVS
jgi:hypothetical protein